MGTVDLLFCHIQLQKLGLTLDSFSSSHTVLRNIDPSAITAQTKALAKDNLRGFRRLTRNQSDTNSTSSRTSSQRRSHLRRSREVIRSLPVLTYNSVEIEGVIRSPEEKVRLQKELLLKEAQAMNILSPEDMAGLRGRPLKEAEDTATPAFYAPASADSEVGEGSLGPKPKKRKWINTTTESARQEPKPLTKKNLNPHKQATASRPETDLESTTSSSYRRAVEVYDRVGDRTFNPEDVHVTTDEELAEGRKQWRLKVGKSKGRHYIQRG